jgi:hypothetical protein
MKVTIFGTCRQHSIKDIFNISSIQENLTYPYNTRELIQAIQFCKGYFFTKDSTQYRFRSGILNKSVLDQEKFIDEYNSSDIIIIEIPSRNYHTYKDMVVHQILENSDVIKHRLNDNEIENDIIKIKELLYPKPFIIVSHVYTYNYGERYQLVKLLDNLTNKYNIPFINPNDTLHKYNNVFINESKLSHYSDYGHLLMREVYRNKIIEVLTTPHNFS